MKPKNLAALALQLPQYRLKLKPDKRKYNRKKAIKALPLSGAFSFGAA